MNLWQSASGWRKAPTGAIFLALICAAPRARSQQFVTDAGWRDVSLAEYRQHLHDLDALVSACQTARAGKNEAQMNSACDPRQVGPDDRVQIRHGAVSGAREVRYDWLRTVLGLAQKKGEAVQSSTLTLSPSSKISLPTIDSLLDDARQRLQRDAKEALAPAQASESYGDQRKALNAILAERAYRGVTEMSPRERFLEWFYNLLDRFLSSLVRLGSRAPWIVTVLRLLLLAAISTALIWFLLRIERRSRVRIVPDVAPSPDAPSAREWQLWLKDAQAMAAKGLWREAIHFLYWAAIARLESRRVWPADRTRTPREYLALLAASDQRKPGLTELTRTFEQTWYGGRAAAATDFDAALKRAAALGVAAE
jgi:hypothetical protein